MRICSYCDKAQPIEGPCSVCGASEPVFPFFDVATGEVSYLTAVQARERVQARALRAHKGR